MPPSAGACQTTDASVKPLWGRAFQWSSTITAIGWREARSGATRRPVSGATARAGVGDGVGDGVVPVGAGVTVAAGVPAGLAGASEGRAATAVPEGEGTGELVDEQAAARIAIAARATARGVRRRGATRVRASEGCGRMTAQDTPRPRVPAAVLPSPRA